MDNTFAKRIENNYQKNKSTSSNAPMPAPKGSETKKKPSYKPARSN